MGNQDQIVLLQIILQWAYPNGKSHCNKKPIGSAASHKTTDCQNIPIKSLNISCDSTVINTGIPKSDSITLDLEVQDTKPNYITKPSKMPPRSLLKRRVKWGKVKKFQTLKMYEKKLDMRAQWSKKSKHDNNARLHINTLNTKFIELRCIMKSVIGAFHNTFPLQDRLLLKWPRVKINKQ